MRKRGVLAAAFLAMAFGVAVADGPAPGPPPNTFTVTLKKVGNPPAAGRFSAKATWAGFQQPWVKHVKIRIYRITNGPDGEKIETYTGQEYSHTYNQHSAADSYECSNATAVALQPGNYRARAWITSDLAMPVNAVTEAESGIEAIP